MRTNILEKKRSIDRGRAQNLLIKSIKLNSPQTLSDANDDDKPLILMRLTMQKIQLIQTICTMYTNVQYTYMRTAEKHKAKKHCKMFGTVLNHTQ